MGYLYKNYYFLNSKNEKAEFGQINIQVPKKAIHLGNTSKEDKGSKMDLKKIYWELIAFCDKFTKTKYTCIVRRECALSFVFLKLSV